MRNFREEIENKIREIYGANAEYVLVNNVVSDEVNGWERFIRNDRNTDIPLDRTIDTAIEICLDRAKRVNDNCLTPVTAQVGEGITVNLWSDRHAGTIIKRTACTITIQYDKATLDPNFKPEWIPGGFSAHCTNAGDQTYTYERDPEGHTEVYRWSKKYQRYQGGGDGSVTVSRGRHEYYDYNF